ncbi:hypothetical protein M9Y10_033321 [Tritrichomonas musculus]|uniref:non-specific serine/threonine protein kinase n=1 Tax=Tritrichomonas musculus TaxID=1915356 RepID=A0ABR2KF21_9EUKA
MTDDNVSISLSNIEGKIIDNFKIMELFSTGGFSKVHFARHIPTNCYCAAKIVDLSTQNTSSFNGIMKEISVYMQVSHPRIVTLYRFSLVSKILIFFLQYAPNGTLLNYVNRYKGLKEMEARRLFIQLFDTVRYLHLKHFLVHRDLKLENILLDKDNNILLTDFGLCDTYYNTTLKSTVGTPGYMPPEVVAGKEYDEKCDVWSLGVCLFLMVSARLPFTPSNDFRVLVSQAETLQFPEIFSSALSDLLRKMLTPSMSNRPSIEKLSSHPFLTGLPPIKMNFMPKPIIFYRITNITDILKYKRATYTSPNIEETIERAKTEVKEIEDFLAEEASKPKESPSTLNTGLRSNSSPAPLPSGKSEPGSPKNIAHITQTMSNYILSHQGSNLNVNSTPKARCSSIKGHRRSTLTLKELSMEKNVNRNSSHDFRTTLDVYHDSEDCPRHVLSPFGNRVLHVNLSNSSPNQKLKSEHNLLKQHELEASNNNLDDELIDSENPNNNDLISDIENDDEKEKTGTADSDFSFTFDVDVEELKQDLQDGKINENTTGFFLLLHSCFKKPEIPKNQGKKVKINHNKLMVDNKYIPLDKKTSPSSGSVKGSRISQNNALPRVIEPRVKPIKKPVKRPRNP